MKLRKVLVYCCAIAAACIGRDARPDEALTREQATDALHRAVAFFRTKVGVQGGYIYKVSADLTRREGEEKVGATTAWIQPPATPAVGMAYLEAYRLANDPPLLEAAIETGMALVNTQLESGGWDNQIEFGPEERRRCAYRVNKHTDLRKLRNTTTFDDDKSQSCLRFLMQLDLTVDQKNAAIHEAAAYAQDAFLKAQYPNGAWPQRYSEFPQAGEFPVLKASYPESWPRTFPGADYKSYYTLNDNTITDLITTMLEAYDLYGEERFLASAKKAGDFYLLAQMPDPQPGWAQQYDAGMHPAWARKFEPPAITGGESQKLMRTLMLLYRRTGDDKYLEPIPRALAYYRTCVLPNGRMARFYELQTNKPLYFTKQYELTYSSDDMPTHYAFIVSSSLDRIATEYEKLKEEGPPKESRPREPERPRMTSSLARDAAEVVAALDERGAWVTAGKLSNYGSEDGTREVIDSRVFIENVETLARFVGAR
jgi:hypothetical protein